METILDMAEAMVNLSEIDPVIKINVKEKYISAIMKFLTSADKKFKTEHEEKYKYTIECSNKLYGIQVDV
jgi:hypothetical protein